MTLMIAWRWRALVMCVFLAPLCATAQVTLTGAIWFASTSTGATNVQQAYADGANNTLGGDPWYDLWVALNPDATLPVNGPSDSQAAISIPLQAGQSYTYYIFGTGPCCTLSYSGLNLFFNGNSSTPGISVFGPLGTTIFQPNSSSTFTLGASPVSGAGTTFYTSAGITVVLTGYNWNNAATPPGDVCQAFSFTPVSGDVPSAYGSFTLQAAQAATLDLGQASGAPGTVLKVKGSGFGSSEEVKLYAGQIGRPSHTVTTGADGSFSAKIPEAQLPYGRTDFFAVGQSSGNIGAANFLVLPALAAKPASGVPGSTTSVQGLGFGAGEVVNVYWNNPRKFLGSTTANTLGSFTGSGALTITIPENASLGANEILGIGVTSKAIGIGTITVR